MQTKHFRHYVLDKWTDHRYHVFIRYYGIYHDLTKRRYIFETNWASIQNYASFAHVTLSIGNRNVTPTVTVKDHQIIVSIVDSISLNEAVTAHFTFQITKDAPRGTCITNEACLKIFNLHQTVMHDMYANTVALVKPVRLRASE